MADKMDTDGDEKVRHVEYRKTRERSIIYQTKE